MVISHRPRRALLLVALPGPLRCACAAVLTLILRAPVACCVARRAPAAYFFGR